MVEGLGRLFDRTADQARAQYKTNLALLGGERISIVPVEGPRKALRAG